MALFERNLAILREQHALFLRAAAHELRTPLQPLQGLAELAEAGQSAEQLAANLEVIKRETARLGAVVDDISLRTELASGTLIISPLVFSPESLLEELARTLEHYYPNQLEIEYTDLPCVMADSGHLRRILWMLLHNALRYSPTNDLICLSVQPHCDEKRLCFCVSDSASRIPRKYREAIFEPLVEMPRLLKRPRFGLGLGLHVAREIARRMGGDLILQPRPSQNGRYARFGNTFVLSLPLG